jgi:hypothetical protein
MTLCGAAQSSQTQFGGLPPFVLFSDLKVKAQLSWRQIPSSKPMIEGQMEVRLGSSEVDGQAFEISNPSDLKVVLWMDMPGGHSHGSAPTQIQRLLVNGTPEPGGYLVRNMFFIMPGSWELRLNLRRKGQSSNQFSEIKVNLQIP